MFTLMPAKTLFTIKPGDKFELRRGRGIEFRLEVVESDAGGTVTVKVLDKEGNFLKSQRFKNPANSLTVRSNMWSTFYGSALYKEHPEYTAPDPVGDDVKSNLILKHKEHYKPQVGDVLFLEPHSDSNNKDSYVAEVVSDPTNTTALVLVYTNLRTNYRYRWVGFVSVAKVPLFGKHFLYFNKGGKKLTDEEKDALSKVCRETAAPEKPVVDKAVPVEAAEEDRPGEYIIWNPASNKPPRVVLKTEKQARAVAHSMAERHGGKFFWARLNGSVERKKHVKVTYENVVTRL